MKRLRAYLHELQNPQYVNLPVQGPLTGGEQEVVNPPPGGDPAKGPAPKLGSLMGLDPEVSSPGMANLAGGTGNGVGEEQQLNPARLKAKYLKLMKGQQESQYPATKEQGQLGGGYARL